MKRNKVLVLIVCILVFLVASFGILNVTVGNESQSPAIQASRYEPEIEDIQAFLGLHCWQFDIDAPEEYKSIEIGILSKGTFKSFLSLESEYYYLHIMFQDKEIADRRRLVVLDNKKGKHTVLLENLGEFNRIYGTPRAVDDHYELAGFKNSADKGYPQKLIVYFHKKK